jgi:hypothetical protein
MYINHLMEINYLYDHAITSINEQKKYCSVKFDHMFFDIALDHWLSQKVEIDIMKGNVKKNGEIISQFVGYDWGELYIHNYDEVWSDFIAPLIGNSVSRLSRGLEP